MDFEYSEAPRIGREETTYSQSGKGKLGRIALSKNICRFELPMDMRRLEKMTPAKYIENYCRVNDRRKAFYKKVFDKYKLKPEGMDSEEYLNLELFEECLIDVHTKSIEQNHINLVVSLACIDESAKINLRLFQGLAALSERVLFDFFVTDDTSDLPDYQKDKIESADFGSLDSKLFGIKISKSMKTLLASL